MDTENKGNINCDKCSSSRLLNVYVQGRDTHSLSYQGLEYNGYMKEGLGLYGNYGDAIDFQICMQCGKVQGNFPKEEETIKEALTDSETD